MQFFNKNSASGTQIIHDETIVYHFVTDIDWCAEQVQSPVDNADGPINASTETAWVSKMNRHNQYSEGG
jgi:hypothetical protein